MSRAMTNIDPRGRRMRYASWDPYDYPPAYYEVPEPAQAPVPVAAPAPAMATSQSGSGQSGIIVFLLILVLLLAGWIAWKTYQGGQGGLGGLGGTVSPPVESSRWVNADNVNMRVQPDERSRVLYTLPRNTQVLLLGEYQTEPDGDTWAKVRVASGPLASQEGWVVYRYLN